MSAQEAISFASGLDNYWPAWTFTGLVHEDMDPSFYLSNVGVPFRKTLGSII